MTTVGEPLKEIISLGHCDSYEYHIWDDSKSCARAESSAFDHITSTAKAAIRINKNMERRIELIFYAQQADPFWRCPNNAKLTWNLADTWSLFLKNK